MAMAAAGAALLAATGASAQSADAQVRTAVELRESPSNDARSLGTLPAQAAVTRTGRQGGWIQVRSAQGATGWVPLFQVVGTGAAGAGAPASGGNAATSALRGLSNVFGSGSQTTTTASLSGVRGLTEEDISRAEPNQAALQQAEALRVDVNAARQFAAAAPLAARAVDPLPEPPRPATASNPQEAR